MYQIELYNKFWRAIEVGKPFLIEQLVSNYNFSLYEAKRAVDSIIEYAPIIKSNTLNNINPQVDYVDKILIRTPQNYPLSNGFWVFSLALILECDIHWLLSGKSNEIVNWLQQLVNRIKFNNEIRFIVEQKSSIISEVCNYKPELFTFIGSSARFNDIKMQISFHKMNLIAETGGVNIAICGYKTNYLKMIKDTCKQIYRHWGQNCNSVRVVYVPRAYYQYLLVGITKQLNQDYSIISPNRFVNNYYRINYLKFVDKIKNYCKKIVSIGDTVKLIEVKNEYVLNLLEEEWMGPAISIIPYDSNNEVYNILRFVEVFSISFWGEFESNFIAKLLLETDFPMHSFNKLVSSNPNNPWYGGNKTGEGFILGKQFVQQFQKKNNDTNFSNKEILSEEVISSNLG